MEILIKLGEYQYMKDLVDDGVVFLNTLEFFRTLEEEGERKDVNEGAVRVRNYSGGFLKIKDSEAGMYEEVAKLNHTQVRESSSNIQNLNVYCLYYVNTKVPLPSLGALMEFRVKNGFGQFAVIITDPGAFVTRIKDAVLAKGYKHFRSIVNYVDLTVDNVEVGPFVKHHEFSYQNELRIAVHTGNELDEAIRLEIGSIKDIAVIVPAELLDEIFITEND